MNHKLVLLIALTIISSGCISTITESKEQPNSDADPKINETSTPSELNSSNNTIVFTGTGFQPSDITVQKGETVTWVSETSKSMWVGSDKHPIHSEYAGTSISQHCMGGDQNSAAFDQCSTGEEFSFTFEKVGQWGYHNHQPFVSGGTVTVVE